MSATFKTRQRRPCGLVPTPGRLGPCTGTSWQHTHCACLPLPVPALRMCSMRARILLFGNRGRPGRSRGDCLGTEGNENSFSHSQLQSHCTCPAGHDNEHCRKLRARRLDGTLSESRSGKACPRHLLMRKTMWRSKRDTNLRTIPQALRHARRCRHFPYPITPDAPERIREHGHDASRIIRDLDRTVVMSAMPMIRTKPQ